MKEILLQAIANIRYHNSVSNLAFRKLLLPFLDITCVYESDRDERDAAINWLKYYQIDHSTLLYPRVMIITPTSEPYGYMEEESKDLEKHARRWV